MDIWYLVADGARARLFKTDRIDGDLEETDVYINEDGRLENKDFDRDRPGRRSQGKHRSAMGDDDGPREHEEKKFAKRLAEMLDDAYDNDAFDRFSIIAAPKMLGHIKKKLEKDTKGSLRGTRSKNLTRMSKEDIQEHISKHLA